MYFPDLSPNNYSGKEKNTILSVGWLGLEEEYETGEVSKDFKRKLKALCDKSINIYRGFHRCEFCSSDEASNFQWGEIGNGEIRIRSEDGTWYIAPKMIYHYVTAHSYKPPLDFIECVLSPDKTAKSGEFDNYP